MLRWPLRERYQTGRDRKGLRSDLKSDSRCYLQTNRSSQSRLIGIECEQSFSFNLESGRDVKDIENTMTAANCVLSTQTFGSAMNLRPLNRDENDRTVVNVFLQDFDYLICCPPRKAGRTVSGISKSLETSRLSEFVNHESRGVNGFSASGYECVC